MILVKDDFDHPANVYAGTGSSTRVQYRLDVEMGFKVPGPVKRTVTGLVIGAALPDLKRYLESGKGSAR